MGDLMASGSDPGSTYTVTGIVPGVYREDRSVTTSLLGTQMYRVYGALFTPGVGWALQTGASAAYATVQNPDGSIHYVTQSDPSGWPTSAWQGSGNNNVYNAVDYGFSTGDTIGTDNTTYLNDAITDIISAGGGTLFIPAGKYLLNGPINITPTATLGMIVAGVSGQTELAQQAVGNMFDVTGVGGGQGVRFRDLRLSFKSQAPTSETMIAINVSTSDAVTCERVYFHNCPTAFQTELHCEFCGLLDCWIDYNSQYSAGGPLDGQTMISLGGSEDFVTNCVIYQVPANNTPPGPSGCTAIALISNNNGHFISNTHITDFAVGISMVGTGSPGLVGVYVSGVLINAVQNAVTIEPSATSYLINDVHFDGCTFAATNYADSGTPGVVISVPSGASPSNVAGIYFTGCSAYGWGNAGIQVGAGQNIVVVGGQYSSNGQTPTAPAVGAGIAVLAGSQVTIVGADCSGVNELWKNTVPGPPVQPYGISVESGVTYVNVDACNLTNNATGALYVTASGTDLRVINCIGYNDQATVLQSTTTAPSTIKYNIAWANVSQGWYGPIAFYIKNAGDVTIDGTNTYLSDGAYTLSPGETASIAGTANHFLAVGK
jgi:hypothetical protein